jgi:hypothetical protein
MSFGNKYLRIPKRFPERLRGVPWGEQHVTIDLSGGPYRFEGLSDLQKDAVYHRFGHLCLKADCGSLPSVIVPVYRAHQNEFRHFDQRAWEYSLDIDCQPTTVRIAGYDFMGRLDWNPELTGAIWTPVDKGSSFHGVFENYFRILFSYRLLECHGVLVHSSCVVDREGGAYLFFGPSGSGKTTVSQLSLDTGRQVLSDDMNAVTPSDHNTVVEKLPFFGDLGPTSTLDASYPLRVVCRLQKGESHKLQVMSRAEATAALLACSPNVNLNPFWQERLVSNLQVLIQSVPVYLLTFARDGGFWDVLAEELSTSAQTTIDSRPGSNTGQVLRR